MEWFVSDWFALAWSGTAGLVTAAVDWCGAVSWGAVWRGAVWQYWSGPYWCVVVGYGRLGQYWRAGVRFGLSWHVMAVMDWSVAARCGKACNGKECRGSKGMAGFGKFCCGM